MVIGLEEGVHEREVILGPEWDRVVQENGVRWKGCMERNLSKELRDMIPYDMRRVYGEVIEEEEMELEKALDRTTRVEQADMRKKLYYQILAKENRGKDAIMPRTREHERETIERVYEWNQMNPGGETRKIVLDDLEKTFRTDVIQDWKDSPGRELIDAIMIKDAERVRKAYEKQKNKEMEKKSGKRSSTKGGIVEGGGVKGRNEKM